MQLLHFLLAGASQCVTVTGSEDDWTCLVAAVANVVYRDTGYGIVEIGILVSHM